MIDLVSLKDFLVLCQMKSFSRAAERCHVSVSGLSRRIQGLEQWAGTPLLVRGKSAVEPTDAGRRLHATATEVVYALEGLRKSFRHDALDRQQRIRFSAPHIMSAVFFADWIPRLHSDFRSARFSVESDNLLACLTMLDEGSTDYVVALFDEGDAVCRRVGLSADDADHQMLELGAERLVPVCVPNAAGAPAYDLRQAGSQPVSFLGYAEECHLGWSLQTLLQRHALKLHQVHEASLTDGLRHMALSGLGVAWLPETLVREDFSAKRLVRAAGPTLEVPLRCVLLRRSAPLSEQAHRLWEYLHALKLGSAQYSAEVLTN
ncbi:LysR family transcriptional regulator [Pigmentiphaga sp. D-2]|uniref:LysR family transcriptional regulator n=1 Tax=Pigmentiphaga sp. D-2 TaxID=1002116 RepID=UPI0010431DE1|nr:LysR family transcriptional regulator [Pigmentiphaga sp. D-2]